MRTSIRAALALLALAVALPVSATFHLWQMSELYSNADGSVQFLELTALASDQEFVAGHTLRSTPTGGATQTFTFPSNLPGNSAGRRMLIGTQGFAALNIVAPDFTVPNGFFAQGGGSLNFAEFADVWNHPATPTGGLSLNRNGSTSTNSPMNFSGATGTVPASTPPPPAASLNFQALWWRSPAGSENGWGVNIVHQGNVLVATWYTYGPDGTAMWMIMSAGATTAERTYKGDIYRATGGPFNAYDPSLFKATLVGTGTFTFIDASNGTFTYTVDGITQSKSITRYLFATPVTTCSFDTSMAPMDPYYPP